MTSGKQIFGMLATIRVELLYETAAEQAEADKMNAQLRGTGFRTGRMVDDWGIQDYAHTATAEVKANPKLQKYPNIKTPLKSGDLMKIFKTVNDGGVLWSGEINYSTKHYHHGYQKRLKPEKWVRMYYDQLPARLERDGKTIFGALEPFSETGTEGVIWSLHEYGKTGYDGLNVLKNGDKLTVYQTVRDGEVDWEGMLDFGPEKAEKVGYSEIMRRPNHMDADRWIQMMWQRRPVILTPK